MYFKKKGEVVIILVLGLLIIAGSLFFFTTGGITGSAITETGLQIQSHLNQTTCCDLRTFGETYELNQSLNTIGSGKNSTCITILNNSITLDCNSFNITYGPTNTSFNTVGINNTGGYDNITIRDCVILKNISGSNNYQYGIHFIGSENSTITNTVIKTASNSNSHGIVLESSNNNFIYMVNITPDSNSINGIHLNGTSRNNNLVNLNITLTVARLDWYSIMDLSTGNNSLVYNSSLGLINWTKTNISVINPIFFRNPGIDFINYRNYIIIENNNVGVQYNIDAGDTYNDPNVNGSAQIEIRNVSYLKTPGLFKDGIRCDNSTNNAFKCNISYDTTLDILYANVNSFSNYSTIFVNVKPLISPVILNTTDISRNDTNVNLTAYANFSDNDTGESVKVIYNWLVNGTSITV